MEIVSSVVLGALVRVGFLRSQVSKAIPFDCALGRLWAPGVVLTHGGSPVELDPRSQKRDRGHPAAMTLSKKAVALAVTGLALSLNNVVPPFAGVPSPGLSTAEISKAKLCSSGFAESVSVFNFANVEK